MNVLAIVKTCSAARHNRFQRLAQVWQLLLGHVSFLMSFQVEAEAACLRAKAHAQRAGEPRQPLEADHIAVRHASNNPSCYPSHYVKEPLF